MKIAIPVDEKTMETNISYSFGRANFFAIYDTVKSQIVFVENTAAQAQGGAGIKAAQIVVDAEPEVLLTPRCGQNAAEVILAADIKIYKTDEGALERNINDFIEGKLPPLTDIHPGHHGQGNS